MREGQPQRVVGTNRACKPTLYRLCMDNLVSVLSLARASGVHPLEIWDVLGGYPTSVETIHRLLCAFNDLRGTFYDLDDLQITLESDRRGGRYV